MSILFENGHTQLIDVDGRLIVMVGGRDWYYPTSYQDAIEKMLKRDWDATIDAIVRLVKEQHN